MRLDLYSLWGAGAALLLALGTTGLLARWQAPASGPGRFVALDGLRGFLAFFVFLHHGSIWFVYLHSQEWRSPASHLYRHFGDSSVALFFMTTAFLFTTQVLDCGQQPIDWTRLYLARLMRLFPLYAFVVGLLWCTAWALTGWTRQVTPGQLFVEALNWLAFTIPHGTSVNGLSDASRILANVTWSLPYEWWFYGCLPVVAVALRQQRIPRRWLAIGLLNLLLVRWLWHLDLRVVPFAGGILAACAARHPGLCRLARQRWTGGLVVALLGLAVGGDPSAYTPWSMALLTLAFVLIACGNDVFGALSAVPSRRLGEISYSVYLLHGLVLFLVSRWLVGWPGMSAWSATEHWGLLMGITVPLILLCHATHRWIELPGRRAAPALRKWWSTRPAAAPLRPVAAPQASAHSASPLPPHH